MTEEKPARADSTPSRDVFLSYSNQDKLTADAICATLEQHELRCWIAPRDVAPGMNYAESIIDGINASRLLVVIFSAASNGSPQVMREVERAVSKGIPIIPFRIEDIKPTKSMEFFLCVPHWLDALTKPMESHIERLRAVVSGVLSTSASPSVPPPDRSETVSFWKRNRVPIAAGVFVAVIVFITAQYFRSNREPGHSVKSGTQSVIDTASATRLKEGFDKYRAAIATGRGSVDYLHGSAATLYPEWLTLAEAGDPVAQLFIGRCYQEGFVVTPNDLAAIPWLEKSAAQGNDYAMLTLGLASELGRGMSPDRGQALAWYTKASTAGNLSAQHLIGSIHAAGVTGTPDLPLAYEWYRKSADAGNAVAMRLVGNCFRRGKGIAENQPEAERWYQKAFEAGDAKMIGLFLGNRMAPHYALYLAANAEPPKAKALAALKAMDGEVDQLDLVSFSEFFSGSKYLDATTPLEEVKKADRSEHPLNHHRDNLIRKYIQRYSCAAVSQRRSNAADFARAVNPLILRLHEEGRNEEIAEFWQQNFNGLVAKDIPTEDDIESLITQAKLAVGALMRTNKRLEAVAVLQTALEASERSLANRPWDWYLQQSYSQLCFDSATACFEFGESAQIQNLLKKGWGVVMKQYGRVDMLSRFPELPMKGNIPADATVTDREFFERFVPKKETASKNSFSMKTMKRFTIPCDFSGTHYPFFIYILPGSRGFPEMQDQFRWVEEVRSGKVPKPIVENFRKINEISKRSNSDFLENSVHALGTAAAMMAAEINGEKPEAPDKGWLNLDLKDTEAEIAAARTILDTIKALKAGTPVTKK